MLKEMNEIVRFTLRKYETRATFRIILLPYSRWKKISRELVKQDQYISRVHSKLAEILTTEQGQRELQTDNVSLEKIRQTRQLVEERLKEYGREPSLEEYLASSAMHMQGKKHNQLPKDLRKKMAATIGLLNQNRDVDLLILVNLSETSRDSPKEQLLTVTHETIHYVESVRERRSSFESIENQSETIVNQFLEKKSAF